MNLVEATEVALELFEASWTDSSLPPYTFKNEVPADAPATWLRLTVNELSSEQRTMGVPGQRKFTRRCQVVAQIFFPAEASGDPPASGGLSPGQTLGDLVRKAFESKSVSGVNFLSPTVGSATMDPDGGGRWSVIRVTAPFYFDETN